MKIDWRGPYPVRALLFAAVVVMVAFGLVIYFLLQGLGKNVRSFVGVSVNALEVASRVVPPLIGEIILKDYADPAAKPEDDLMLLHRALDNFSLLVKGDDPLPLGANEDIADALRGRNKARLRFLPDDSLLFDSQGRIIDRWKTPLYFHATASDRLEIRSAGPDRVMWSADDLHRMPDGSFVRGDDLLAPSVFGAETPTAPVR